MAVDQLTQSYLADFALEADEIRARITGDLVTAEAAPARSEPLAKAYKSLARGLHTLKGSGATLGLSEIASLAHALEDMIAPLQRGQEPFPASAADEFLQALDHLMATVHATADGRPETTPTASIATSAAPSSGPAMVSPAEAPGERDPQAAADVDGWRVGWTQLRPIAAEMDRLRQARLRTLDIRQRVSAVISTLAAVDGDGRTAEARVVLAGVERALRDGAEATADLVVSLEDSLKAICTVPAATALEPLQRSVRDLCRGLGKEARLSLVGGELRIDRRILESLRGPLIHLIRNAVDHGIEAPEVRQQQGKHRAGALVIRIEQQGNIVFLEVSDDGAGMDPERLRAAAVAKGVITQEEAAIMHAAQVMQLIFRSGFSTRLEVTDTSGRGVGLDVVDSEVRALDGRIEVTSLPGQGTRFAVMVPAKMGGVPLLSVRCGEHEIAVPLLAVEHILPMRASQIRGTRLLYEGDLIKLGDLGAMLGLRQPVPFVDGQPLLLVTSEGHRLGLLVDAVLGDHEAALSPLPEDLRRLPPYQGAVTRARGDLLLVLRPAWIVGAEPVVAQSSQILVIDDSLTARALHRTSLEAGGYAVHAVAGARQAMALLAHTSYDAIVCDIGMEDIDGVAFTELVRNDPARRDTPILLVSASEDHQDRERGLRAGADGFLSKKDCIGGRLVLEVSSALERRKRAA